MAVLVVAIILSAKGLLIEVRNNIVLPDIATSHRLIMDSLRAVSVRALDRLLQ